MRGKRDIAVGNVTGSNIFDILGVLPITAIALVTSVVRQVRSSQGF